VFSVPGQNRHYLRAVKNVPAQNCLTVQHHLAGHKIRDTSSLIFPEARGAVWPSKTNPSRPAKKSQPKTKAKNSAGFAAAFSARQKMLEPYEKSLQRIPGRSDRYWLETKCDAYKGRPFLFCRCLQEQKLRQLSLGAHLLKAGDCQKHFAGPQQASPREKLLQFHCTGSTAV
jgi:hypothetical protein